mgnify:CR=1 FL=1
MYGSYLAMLKRATRFRTRRRQLGYEPPEFQVVRRRRRPPERTCFWNLFLPSLAAFVFSWGVLWLVAQGEAGHLGPRWSLVIAVGACAVLAVRAYACAAPRPARLASMLLALACVPSLLHALLA